jgi:hypothetical protein
MALKKIRAIDLIELRNKQAKEDMANKANIKLIADLMVEDKKKDLQITQLTQMVNTLNIEVNKLKGVAE